uniref:Anaphase-promoting complex subunit 4 n=1 Tax=Kwoniella pini CBS 10737 TaxID=1296096 RepID=A0A1B9I0W4_9TREE|nr:uncharacterized protein I206_04867 [Kwoniella pini CBS 10737]OCF49179.1 hypothetical protein I206_04867 [Kwoniella pini CBS 10737]
MILPDRTSFTPLSTISLPSSHILHPGSCNPSMDLVVLLSHPFNPSSNSWKGKGKEIGKTQISLWRTGGSKVWEVNVTGQVVGLAWSEDGLILSLFTWSNERTIDHLSVHTGEVIRSIPFPQNLNVGHIDDLRAGKWIDMKWVQAQNDWDRVKNGSSINIIDSLPTVTPVDPPKPPNLLPFMQKSNKPEPRPTFHSLLKSFPSLLPSNIPLPPNILSISSYPFLTGTLPLPPSQGKENAQEILELSKISDRMSGYLDIILRGLENAEIAFRESEKQTMICREDLETCAQQQAMTIPDVHSDLFRFLMTGRSGVAVNEWLGSKLTGRTLTKWDQTLDSSYKSIQNLIIESISPALERLVLLLEEMKGWSRTPRYQARIQLREDDVVKATDLVLGFAKLMEKMRRDAEHEMKAASEFMKWLKYDDIPTPTHDLKLVWSFMINGFVHSSFHDHFPYLSVRPPKDFLPDEFTRYTRKPNRNLDEVLKETQTELGIIKKEIMYTPSTKANESLNSTNGSESTMSMDMSMSVVEDEDNDEDVDRDLTPTGILSEDEEDLLSSPDTVERKNLYAVQEEEEIERKIEKEPWVWINTLVRDLEKLIKDAIGLIDDGYNLPLNDGMRDKRIVQGGLWEVLVSKNDKDEQQIWLMYTSDSASSSPSATAKISTFALFDSEQSLTCLSIQFFDDDEIVLLLESENGRYLVTLRYVELLDLEQMVEMNAILPIPISRSRYLGVTPQFDTSLDHTKVAIALNGRTGRRLGCVAFEDGRSLQVWDLDVDEDEEDEDEQEEQEDGEGEES